MGGFLSRSFGLIAGNRSVNQVGAGMEGSVGQNISATDVLCEGPIYGLVNGQASLYLDDNPAVDAKYHGFAPTRSNPSSSGGNAGTITFSNGTVGTVDSNTFIPAALSNYAGGPRICLLYTSPSPRDRG